MVANTETWNGSSWTETADLNAVDHLWRFRNNQFCFRFWRILIDGSYASTEEWTANNLLEHGQVVVSMNTARNLSWWCWNIHTAISF